MSFAKKISGAAVLALFIVAPALADDAATVNLTIKDHRFEPAEIRIPAGKPVTLQVKNLDASPEEFDSDDLKIEKSMKGNDEATIHVKALQVGRYEFEGEYHSDTAHGVIIAE